MAPVWTREIADEIKHQLKEKNYPRYKYAVQVVIGEQKGEGVKCAHGPRRAFPHACHRSFPCGVTAGRLLPPAFD